MTQPVYYADSGINWNFLYQVEYEDADIVVLIDLGRFHKYAEDRQFKKPINAYIEVGIEYAYILGKAKLVEIKQPANA